jgi:uncharacterized membrane protein YgcG
MSDNTLIGVIVGIAVLAVLIVVGLYFYNKNKDDKSAYYNNATAPLSPAAVTQPSVTYVVPPSQPDTYVVDTGYDVPYLYGDYPYYGGWGGGGWGGGGWGGGRGFRGGGGRGGGGGGHGGGGHGGGHH